MNHATALRFPIFSIAEFDFMRFALRASSGALALLLCFTIILSGCTFASFVAAAEARLPVVVQMITNITNVVAAPYSPAIQAFGALAIASLQIACGNPAPGARNCDPASLVGQFQAATDPALKTLLLQKIQAALQSVQGHLADILKLAGPAIPQFVQIAITTGIGLAVLTIGSLISLIPPSLTPAAIRATIQQATQPPSRRDLIKRFNAAVSGQFPAATIR
jgi:hypothetical protein